MQRGAVCQLKKLKIAADRAKSTLIENKQYGRNSVTAFLRLLGKFRKNVNIGVYYVPTKEETEFFIL